APAARITPAIQNRRFQYTEPSRSFRTLRRAQGFIVAPEPTQNLWPNLVWSVLPDDQIEVSITHTVPVLASVHPRLHNSGARQHTCRRRHRLRTDLFVVGPSHQHHGRNEPGQLRLVGDLTVAARQPARLETSRE